MELSETQRQVIEANALRTCWQQLAPWMLRQLGTTTATPGVLVEWLQQASDRAQGPALELLRHMEQRIWQVHAPAAAADAPQGLLQMVVDCSGLRRTLWLQRPPSMRVLQIGR